jgi:HSP20 family protein
MNLVKWNPFNEMMDLRNRMNRVFGDSFLPAFEGREDLSLSHWNPAVDIYEDDNAIVITAELPGIDKDHITIDVKGRVLTLKGERNSENEVKEENFYRRERVYGKFERAFTLPAGIDPESVKADFKDGVLKIDLPKPEEEKPKQITIH